MKNNIWYVSKYANTYSFGANTRHASFCKEFSKAGHNVRLITSNSSHLFDSLPEFKTRYYDVENEGFNVTWINTLKYNKVASLKRLLSWVWFEFFVISMSFSKRYEKPSVVIISSLSLLSVFSGCFYKKFHKAKFIFEVRDIWPQTLIELKDMSHRHPLVWFLKKVEMLGYKYSDAIVGTMPGLKGYVEENFSLGYKVEVIPQGVDLCFYKNNQTLLSNKFIKNYIPLKKFIVTYAGAFGEANALEYIIEAAIILDKNKSLDVHFLLVGEGYLKNNLIDQAKGLSNITFAPMIEKSQVQHALSLSDVLVASVRNESIYRYGISLNKFIDYMYAKKPVICMFSGFQSMINEAGCGEFVPAGDSKALAETIEKYRRMSDQDRKNIGEKGYNFLVNKRSFSKLSVQFMEVFNEKSI